MDISIKQLIVAGIFFANFFFILFILCVERKKPAFALSWILTLIFLPWLGFLLYLFLGTNAVIRRKRRWIGHRQPSERSVESCDNEVDIFIAAKEKYRRLMRDIEEAEQSICVLYFIIRNDRVGRLFLALLAKKARQGVAVHLLYDHAGCWLTPTDSFQELAASGAKVKPFFPIHWGHYLRVNFRNHRKLVVIDGKIGFLGGMNIGEEYMGVSAAHLPWRDTHLRICGSVVRTLEQRFWADWRFSSGDEMAQVVPTDLLKTPRPAKESGSVRMRITASGPDAEEDEIKWDFLRMIYAAKRIICIQTPYFIPDDSFLEALKAAAFSGVQVTIMGPSRSDNYIAHQVSLSYLGELLDAGVAVYFYPGFLHAKMLLVDDEVVSVGSANMDMRSFSLNFELNAFMYGNAITGRFAEIFQKDLAMAAKMEPERYARRSLPTRMREGVFRLIAPLL